VGRLFVGNSNQYRHRWWRVIMIRLTGLVNLRPVVTLKGSALEEAELTDKQKQLDVDKDGKIEGDDLAKLRAKNETHGGDHEVSMAQGLLDDIIRSATELKAKMGAGEKDIPAWIQDHISQAQNFINQASTNYHEYNTPMENMPCEGEGCMDAPVTEKAPEGWEGTVKAMKDEPGIDNPWALAHWMKNKGYKSHKGQ
jgi:CYTH domain-containing protein